MNYSYKVNGKNYPQSQRFVNDSIRKMSEKPEVIKIETHNNGITSERQIEVKGRKGNFTIL